MSSLLGGPTELSGISFIRARPLALEDCTLKSHHLPQAPPPKFNHHLGGGFPRTTGFGGNTTIQLWQGSNTQETSLMMACQVCPLMWDMPGRLRRMEPVNCAAELVPGFVGQARSCATLPCCCFVVIRVRTALEFNFGGPRRNESSHSLFFFGRGGCILLNFF